MLSRLGRLFFVELPNRRRQIVSMRNYFEYIGFRKTNRPDVRKSSTFLAASSFSFSSKLLFVAFLFSRDLTGLVIALRVLLTRTDFDFLRDVIGGCGCGCGCDAAPAPASDELA